MAGAALSAALLPPFLADVAARAAQAPGTISGTISLTTNDPHGLARIPAGSVITVWAECEINAPHPHTCTTRNFVVPANAASVRYSLAGISYGPVVVTVLAQAMNRGPHDWSAILTDMPHGTVSPSAPHLVADVSASGAHVPLDATADGTSPLGSEQGAIYLHRASPHGPLPSSLPAGLQIVAYAANDATQRPIATATASAIYTDSWNEPTASYHLYALPLDTRVAIRVVAPAGSAPLLSYRHVDQRSNPLGPQCTFTLPRAVEAIRRYGPDCSFSAVPASPAASSAANGGSFAGR